MSWKEICLNLIYARLPYIYYYEKNTYYDFYFQNYINTIQNQSFYTFVRTNVEYMACVEIITYDVEFTKQLSGDLCAA